MKTATMAAVAACLAIAAVVQVRSPGRSSLAYAEVEASMRQIKTSTWTQTRLTYDRTTKRTFRKIQRATVRMTPVALRTDTAGVAAEICTPEMLKVERFPEGASFLYFAHRVAWADRADQETGRAAFSRTEAMRQFIMNHLLAPIVPIYIAQTRHLRSGEWSVADVIRNGRRYWRFGVWTDLGEVSPGPIDREDRRLFNEAMGTDERLAAGIRLTRSVDPASRRVVRMENETVDDEGHTLTISDHFTYDRPLPDSLFQPAKSH